MLALVSAALASTVAVLPLDRGAGGEAWDGLGKALAGMLTTDLSTAPGLTLVERARLDALLGEIGLKDTGFLDEATAQKLGKGLGAEYVVVGSYSVVGDQFLLDARIVGVETAKVVRAADAHGTVAAFVDVEKSLVTGLLDGLQVSLAEEARKKLLAAAPTRDFDAFAAYGEGLALQDAGKLPEARDAFGRALAEDPAFSDAATALGGLRMALDRMQADALRSRQKARADLLDKVVATYPPPKDGKDTKALPGFALRLLALDEQGRHCQRYDELRAWLDATGWGFDRDDKDYKQLWVATTKAAVDVGYAPDEKADPQVHRDAEFRIQTDGVRIFMRPASTLYGFPTMLVDVPSSDDLVTTMTRCLSVPEQLTALGELAAAAKAHGVERQAVPGGHDVGLAERLEWSALAIRAKTSGVDDAMRVRIEALIALHDGETHDWLVSQAKQLAMMGEAVERARVRRLGFRDAELAAAVEALASGDPARFTCAPLLPTWSAWAKRVTGDLTNYTGVLAPMRDLGCFPGTPARFATPEAAFEHVATAPSRARPENAAECAEAFREVPEKVAPKGWDGKPAPLDLQHAYEVLQWYDGSLVLPLCVSD